MALLGQNCVHGCLIESHPRLETMVLLLSRVTGVPGFYISKQLMKPLKLEVPDLDRLVMDAFLHAATHALNLFLSYFFISF